MPKHIVSEAKAAHKQLGSIKAIAEKHIDGSTQISDEDKPITEDKTIVPNAQESHKALTDLMDSLHKHGKKPAAAPLQVVSRCGVQRPSLRVCEGSPAFAQRLCRFGVRRVA